MEFSSRESVENRYVPNAGFLEDVVFEDPSFVAAPEESDSYTQETCALEEQDDEHNVQPELVVGSELQSENDDQFQISDKIETSEVMEEALSGLSITDSAPAGPSDEKERHSLSSVEIDALLDKCLLQALHNSVVEKDLPISGSTLWY